jgi:hypothetical protein
MSICNLPTRLNLISNENDLSPCSDLEIIQLERQQGINLPSTYKDFLKMMGHGAGKFLRGLDCFYQHLPKIQEWAKQLLVENDFPQTLPEDAFVFFMHQGYQFSFFRLSEGDNPPTYSYCEGQEQPYFIKSHDQFSDFLSVEINLYLKSLMLLSDLTDYIDAFYHHCEQGNYQFAFDTLKAGDDLFNQPENHEKCLELYIYLVERLELQETKESKNKSSRDFELS